MEDVTFCRSATQSEFARNEIPLCRLSRGHVPPWLSREQGGTQDLEALLL